MGTALSSVRLRLTPAIARFSPRRDNRLRPVRSRHAPVFVVDTDHDTRRLITDDLMAQGVLPSHRQCRQVRPQDALSRQPRTERLPQVRAHRDRRGVPERLPVLWATEALPAVRCSNAAIAHDQTDYVPLTGEPANFALFRNATRSDDQLSLQPLSRA